MKFVERPLKQPHFPDFQEKGSWISNLLQFIVGVFLWVGLTCVFLFALYTDFFIKSLQVFVRALSHKNTVIPFWVAGLCVFFFFPLTVLIIVISYILNYTKK